MRKSLQPAARAATRSLCKDDAVSATMITDDLYGDDVEVEVEGASDGVRKGGVRGTPSERGVARGKPDEEFIFSINLISFVA